MLPEYLTDLIACKVNSRVQCECRHSKGIVVFSKAKEEGSLTQDFAPRCLKAYLAQPKNKYLHTTYTELYTKRYREILCGQKSTRSHLQIKVNSLRHFSTQYTMLNTCTRSFSSVQLVFRIRVHQIFVY